MTKIYLLDSTDPYRNLAFEEAFFRHVPQEEPEKKHILIWRNRPSVVIGRFQNPWLEADLARLKKDGTLLARRISGGGTVYHDGGNLNLTFFFPSPVRAETSSEPEGDTSTANGQGSAGLEPAGNGEALDEWKMEHLQLPLAALYRLGILATTNDRGDIVVQAKKISGSAYRQSGGWAYHHATLLVSSDGERLRSSLSSPFRVFKKQRKPKKQQGPATLDFESRGTDSVPAVITQVADHLYPSLPEEVAAANASPPIAEEPMDRVIETLLAEADGLWGPVEFFRGRDAWPAWVPSDEVNELQKSLSSDEWIFGKTPRFVHSLGPMHDGVTLKLEVKDGLIHSVEGRENSNLIGHPYDSLSLRHQISCCLFSGRLTTGEAAMLNREVLQFRREVDGPKAECTSES